MLLILFHFYFIFFFCFNLRIVFFTLFNYKIMLVERFHWFQHFFNILLINLLFVLLFQIVIAIFKWIVHWDYFSFFFNNESHWFFWRLRLILFCVYIFSCYFFFNVIFNFLQYFLINKKFLKYLVSIENLEIVELIQNFDIHSDSTVLYFVRIN